MNTVLFSAKSDEWETPEKLFNGLNEEFNFNLDPCATDQNHKCSRYYTAEQDGLNQNWGGTGCFAIHPIAKYHNGLRRHTGRLGRTIRW